jgi:peptidoglycan DL-endopeptidase CwlO
VRIPASQAQPGDLVFFVGSDGTPTQPGHVGLVIGGGKMIEAYATGFPIRVATYTNRDPIGFTRPWANANVSVGSQ